MSYFFDFIVTLADFSFLLSVTPHVTSWLFRSVTAHVISQWVIALEVPS